MKGGLGIDEEWNGVVVKPELPAGWMHAQATVTYKSRLMWIKINKTASSTRVTRFYGGC